MPLPMPMPVPVPVRASASLDASHDASRNAGSDVVVARARRKITPGFSDVYGPTKAHTRAAGSGTQNNELTIVF